MSALTDLIRGHVLGHGSIQGGFIQGPTVLTAGCLHQGSQVGLWDVETTQPHNRWLTLVDLVEGKKRRRLLTIQKDLSIVDKQPTLVGMDG